MKNEVKLFSNNKVNQIGRILNRMNRSTKVSRRNNVMSLILSRKKEISDLINSYERGYGFKIIAREIGISYVVCRSLFLKLEEHGFLTTRKGKNVVTDALKIFRKEKAEYEAKTNTGWNSFETRANLRNKKDTRGISGYYWNKTFNKYVWLRSSWEYVYAKWLDSKNIPWDSECKYFFTKSGKYLPDFFIFEEDLKTIKYLVEIKGYSGWDRGRHFELEEDIDLVFINDIKKFIPQGSKEHKERIEWKLIRKMEV